MHDEYCAVDLDPTARCFLAPMNISIGKANPMLFGFAGLSGSVGPARGAGAAGVAGILGASLSCRKLASALGGLASALGGQKPIVEHET